MDKKVVLKEFGRNLRAERNRLGLSQEGLAEKIGLSSFQTIGKIENGNSDTSLTTVVSILNILNLNFEDLFDYKKFNG